MLTITILGGGISGLSSLLWLNQLPSQYKIQLIEKSDRLGGKIHTEIYDSNLCEYGPSSFMTSKPELKHLITDLNLFSQLISHNKSSEARFIYSQNTLYQVPTNPLKFLCSNLVSPLGKLRMGYGLLKPKIKNHNPTVAQFISHHLGDEFLNKVVSPAIAGIYANSPQNLSVNAVLPTIFQYEQQYGNLLNTFLKLKQHKKLAEFKLSGLSSFKNGMQGLINQLEKSAKPGQIILNQAINDIQYQDGKFKLNNGQFLSDIVVATLPSYQLRKVFQNTQPGLSDLFAKINYTPIIVVISVYHKNQVPHHLKGFGHLYAANFKLPILGSLWESSIFNHRTDTNKVLIRTMLNARKHPELLNYSQQELEDLVAQSLSLSLKIKTQPLFTHIVRDNNAIPEYGLSHTDTIAQILNFQNKMPGLFFTGNLYSGVGMNDCLKRTLHVLGLINSHLSNNTPG